MTIIFCAIVLTKRQTRRVWIMPNLFKPISTLNINLFDNTGFKLFFVNHRMVANRVSNQERHEKQNREELEREKVRSAMREKYGIAAKKVDSPQEIKAIQVIINSTLVTIESVDVLST